MLPILGTVPQTNQEPILMGSYKVDFLSGTPLKIITFLDWHPPILLELAPR